MCVPLSSSLSLSFVVSACLSQCLSRFVSLSVSLSSFRFFLLLVPFILLVITTALVNSRSKLMQRATTFLSSSFRKLNWWCSHPQQLTSWSLRVEFAGPEFNNKSQFCDAAKYPEFNNKSLICYAAKYPDFNNKSLICDAAKYPEFNNKSLFYKAAKRPDFSSKIVRLCHVLL